VPSKSKQGARCKVKSLYLLGFGLWAVGRPVGMRKIFDFGAGRARCAAPPLKNRRLSPFGAKFTRGRSRKGAYEMFDFGARRALFQRV
jgi:hypothetical protein